MVLHPSAETRLHSRHVSISGAEFAIAKPKDQRHKETHIAKNIRFKVAFGFLWIRYSPKNR